MACAIPGAGELYMGYMAATGHDAISGTCLSAGDRLVTLAAFALPMAAPQILKSIKFRPRPSNLHIPDGNLNGGWEHINARHITGNHPTKGAGDLFAPGTTRQQVEDAARQLGRNGTRQTEAGEPLQAFEGRLKVNRMRARYRVIVHMPSGEVVTIYPMLGGE